MKINGNAIRPGNIISHQDRLWKAIKIAHTQPGKGGAYLQVELRDIKDGTKLNERFRSSETVERVSLTQKKFQYLYTDGQMYTFMDMQSYDQIELTAELIGEDNVIFLQENMEVEIEFFEEEPLGVALPPHMTFEVIEADAVVKGQTASSSYKPAKLENGARIMVPPHIEAGTRIVIHTEDKTYVERAKD